MEREFHAIARRLMLGTEIWARACHERAEPPRTGFTVFDIVEAEFYPIARNLSEDHPDSFTHCHPQQQ